MGQTASPSRTPSASVPTPRPGYTPEAQKLLKFRWAPKTRLQVEALNSAADILGMGGAAGSLKTFTLLADAVQEFRNSNLRAILFRESFPNLRDVILKSFKIYKRYPYYGDYNKAEHVWRFPTNARELADPRNIERVASGELKPIYVDGACATIEFKYLSNYLDCEINHQGQEYSWIGFDEATHFTEDMIQYLLTRLRSVDPTLRLRMRLATNPGGIGHAWFMKLFVGEDCPHCDPQSKRCRKPFLLYKDAQWMDGQPLTQMIDGQEVIYTTQFIPGHLGDHEFFGAGNVKYKALLRMQRPATAKALEEGCWRAFEGQYFDVWEENRGISLDDVGNIVVPTPDMRMVVPRGEIEAEYWWPHYTGTDYGFTLSNTGAVLCMRTPADQWFPNGRTYVLDEYLEPRKLAEDAAQELLDRWFLDENGKVPDNSRAIQMWALSHDAFNEVGVKASDTGVSITRADQMNERLRPFGMQFIRANNERPGGWQHIYRMLRSGELVICDNCVELMQAIPSRVKDPKKLDDIAKVIGDKHDDLMDALRYAIYSYFKVGPKPVALELAERVKDLDPTNAMITRLKFSGELAAKSGPVFVGRNAAQRNKLFQQSRMRRKPI